MELLAFRSALAERLDCLPERETGPHIDHLPLKCRSQLARVHEWLVQLKLADTSEPVCYQVSRSLGGAEDVQSLRLLAHAASPMRDGGIAITTTLAHGSGAEPRHVLRWALGDAFFCVQLEFANGTTAPLTL